MINWIFKRIAEKMPGLNIKLQQAGMNMRPDVFVKRTFASAFYLTTGLMVFLFGILSKTTFPKQLLYVVFIIMFFLMYFYMLRVPDVRIIKARKAIDKEIVFVARFLIIETDSGISLYAAMKNASKNYEAVGKYFKEITDRVDMGTSMGDAINEIISASPSWRLKRILWQILNVMNAGSDISKSLNAVTEQIVREQIIEVNSYGKRLNPIAMFYMIVAVILPSLGITMFIVLSSFLGLNINLLFLMIIVGFLAFIQFMFVAIIKSSRPAVEI